jgi:hypothetical protein
MLRTARPTAARGKPQRHTLQRNPPALLQHHANDPRRLGAALVGLSEIP